LQSNNGTEAQSLCAPPRLNSPSNVLCGQCEAGYVAWGADCVECTAANGGLCFAMFVLSIALVLFLVRGSRGASAGSVAVLLYFAQV
jgi:hypothetical protein